MFWFLIAFLLQIVIRTATVHGDDYVYIHDEEDYYYDVNELPKFLAKPQRFSVEVGGAITFPCDVDRVRGPLLLMFKYISPRGRDRTFYAGDAATGRYPRLRKEGSSFVLKGVKKSDTGSYICLFETDPVVQVRHELNVKYPAQVQRGSQEIEKVAQGTTFTLQCNASGNPFPAITWSKENGRLPSGAQSEEGESITLGDVDRHVEGTYICTASNGIGEPASTKITLQVEYKPDIVTKEEIVRKKDNTYEAQLVCVVHGRPTPRVSWYIGEELVSSSRYIMQHDGGHRHSLQIKDVRDVDFRTYTCRAVNSHGDVSKNLTLTGLPRAPIITSSPAGGEKQSYTLTWKTESFAPITQYRVKYRKVKDNRTNNGPNTWMDHLFSPPKVTERDTITVKGVHEMAHPFRKLSPAVDYETKICVENKFGWSADSEIFKFHTRKELAVGRSSVSSGNIAKLYPGLLVAVLAAVGQSSNSANSVKLVVSLLVPVLLINYL